MEVRFSTDALSQGAKSGGPLHPEIDRQGAGPPARLLGGGQRGRLKDLLNESCKTAFSVRLVFLTEN